MSRRSKEKKVKPQEKLKEKALSSEEIASGRNANPPDEPIEAETGLAQLQATIADQTTLIQKQSAQIEQQTKAILALNSRLQDVEKHSETQDKVTEEVIKRVGVMIGGSGGEGGEGGLQTGAGVNPVISSLLRALVQPRAGPMEKLAEKMFLRNIAFSTLLTERMARNLFGKQWTTLVKDLDAGMLGLGEGEGQAGAGTEGSTE